jgi:hypothetical protein
MNLKSKGFSMIAEKDRASLIKAIPEKAFTEEGALPRVPDAKDELALAKPPDLPPGEKLDVPVADAKTNDPVSQPPVAADPQGPAASTVSAKPSVGVVAPAEPVDAAAAPGAAAPAPGGPVPPGGGVALPASGSVPPVSGGALNVGPVVSSLPPVCLPRFGGGYGYGGWHRYGGFHRRYR